MPPKDPRWPSRYRAAPQVPVVSPGILTPEVLDPLVDGARDYALEAESVTFRPIRKQTNLIGGYLKSNTPEQDRYERALDSLSAGAHQLERLTERLVQTEAKRVASLLDVLLFGAPVCVKTIPNNMDRRERRPKGLITDGTQTKTNQG